MLIQIRRWARRRVSLAVMLALLLSLAFLSTGVRADGRNYTQEDAEMLARTVWGEARGCSATQQAAVVWCILNRVDNEIFPNSIRKVVTQPNQFAGYRPGNPVEPEILALVTDVLGRWTIETSCIGSVGRVLPASYLYFSGDGTENRFREGLLDTETWDWALPSPYDAEEQKESSLPQSGTFWYPALPPLMAYAEIRPGLFEPSRIPYRMRTK